MTICLSDAGKRFNRDWIFRHFNYTFNSGTAYAIIGANGSGKSTLLQCIAGSMMLSEGKAEWLNESSKAIDPEKVYSAISICAPYLELIEEMTLTEFFDFHQAFKPFLKGHTPASIIEAIGMQHAAKKQIRLFSSGMKQRAKLAQCIFSDTPIVLLDEPCTNLDKDGIALYQQLVEQYCKNRIVIVSSNDEVEYAFCSERISMRS